MWPLSRMLNFYKTAHPITHRNICINKGDKPATKKISNLLTFCLTTA
jgi:hypothetical protein